jgi:hypothetical protein
MRKVHEVIQPCPFFVPPFSAAPSCSRRTRAGLEVLFRFAHVLRHYRRPDSKHYPRRNHCSQVCAREGIVITSLPIATIHSEPSTLAMRLNEFIGLLASVDVQSPSRAVNENPLRTDGELPGSYVHSLGLEEENGHVDAVLYSTSCGAKKYVGEEPVPMCAHGH